jgi:hypothetical protein
MSHISGYTIKKSLGPKLQRTSAPDSRCLDCIGMQPFPVHCRLSTTLLSTKRWSRRTFERTRCMGIRTRATGKNPPQLGILNKPHMFRCLADDYTFWECIRLPGLQAMTSHSLRAWLACALQQTTHPTTTTAVFFTTFSSSLLSYLLPSLTLCRSVRTLLTSAMEPAAAGVLYAAENIL